MNPKKQPLQKCCLIMFAKNNLKPLMEKMIGTCNEFSSYWASIQSPINL